MAAVYGLERLLEDAGRRCAGARARGAKTLAAVWRALDLYAADCLERQRGLRVHNFCQIGWLEQRLRGRTVYRLQFQAVPGTPLPDTERMPVEEFNFSKAAIRFSQSLTKD
ncbi:unnamed protein product, partial [Prorocentrum cordatum]